MLTGFNTDFKYKGVVYHVQTEDNGLGNPVIVTLLYQGGAILASRKINYADILKSEHLQRVVSDLMRMQHKQIIKDLVAGNFGQTGPAEADTAGTAAGDEKPVSETAEDKGLDSIILDYLASEEEG
jgi:hypothetical protein